MDERKEEEKIIKLLGYLDCSHVDVEFPCDEFEFGEGSITYKYKGHYFQMPFDYIYDLRALDNITVDDLLSFSNTVENNRRL